MRRFVVISALLFVSALPLPAQNQLAAGGAVANAETSQISADYPSNCAGILIGDKQWTAVASQTPSKTKVAHAIAAGLSYGLAPAKIVAEYDGEHSPTHTDESQPVLCICHFSSIPGSPVLVRLHEKKNARELNGGRMTVYPVVGGSKLADASKTDLIAADISHPEQQVWLLRPQTALTPGEYALMLGTQNIIIFPFTVDPAPPAQTAAMPPTK